MTKLRVLDLFSGIGGFSLGLERATSDGEYTGFETVAFCEIENFPRRVLAKHWPDVPCYDDVRTLTAERLAADGIASIDVITGGFPCQDLSSAGRRAGIGEGTRSGLYGEILRLARDIRPRFIIMENVAGLLSGPSEQPGQWFGRVLGDLACLGYDAEWENIPAASLGAPHRRERIWIVANPAEDNDAQFKCIHRSRKNRFLGDSSAILANSDDLHEQGQQFGVTDAQGWSGQVFRSLRPCSDVLTQWETEPGVGRVADGVPDRTHRLAALGNSVVPQIPELIGNAILASMETQ